jgi:hypothetical protein
MIRLNIRTCRLVSLRKNPTASYFCREFVSVSSLEKDFSLILDNFEKNLARVFVVRGGEK